jgi:hypothetical protein
MLNFNHFDSFEGYSDSSSSWYLFEAAEVYANAAQLWCIQTLREAEAEAIGGLYPSDAPPQGSLVSVVNLPEIPKYNGLSRTEEYEVILDTANYQCDTHMRFWFVDHHDPISQLLPERRDGQTHQLQSCQA